MAIIYKKVCVQVVFYFLTAAEKYTLLLLLVFSFYWLASSVFSMVYPTE